MKKILALLLVFVLVAVVLGACARPVEDPVDDPVEEPVEEPVEDPADEPAEEPAEKVTITYANWALGAPEADTLARRMVKAFNEAHPHIEVVIDEAMDYSKYEESLTAAAAAGTLPDVMMMAHVPFGLQNDWLLDISEFTQRDDEWANIPKPLADATRFGRGIFAVPTGMFFMGYFVNDDLFEEYNVPALNFSPTIDEFSSAIRALTRPADGIIGLAEENQIVEWYPSAVNNAFGWFTWDGEKFNLNTPEFIQGVNFAREIFQNRFTFDSLTEEQRAEYGVGWFGEVWDQGKIAVRWDGTWATSAFAQREFNNRFIGVPGGRTIIVPDFLVLSNASNNPEAAYEFARWVSFAREGIMKAMELGIPDRSFTSLPVTTDEEVLNEYFEHFAYPGIRDAFDAIDRGVVEGFKFVPGYVQSRWAAPTGVKVGDNDNASMGDVIWNAVRGDIRIEDHIEQIDKLANDEHKKVLEIIEGLLGN